ncbi:ferritin family protein [Desulfuromonas carbonis]|uniref:ferritin-like domain-containing protein n=1 Tax=Desulfuromonas sp. DDH964 TaxID=1823759 RepID=UPI00078C7DF0|nr:ferritin family protein [Desulfuromonas sp. DDH964]AMV73468.1 ferritin-like domain-containing protein [Desulfuromonas sp. DDH964]
MTVLDFARHLEQSGRDFYTEMAARTSQDGVRKIFQLLAGDQQRLLDRLRRMQERPGTLSKAESLLLNRAVNIFEKMRQREAQLAVNNDLDAYLLAINAERQIVDQYLKVLNRTDNADLRQALLRVLSLDRQELEELEQLYDFVNAPTDSLEWGEFSNLDEFHNFGRYDDLRQGELGDPVIPEPVKH